jgi:branched-chain amino acid transport system substrate-binding protein
MRRWVLAAALAGALATPAAARAQVIYSSLPLTGAGATDGRDTLAGEQMALAEAGAPVTLISLNDATLKAGTWDPATVASNARRAAADARTLAYLGDGNSGASAISLPILNQGPIPQISPSNTYTGLTRRGPETGRGEPHKYYPTAKRTYVRVIPADHLQAKAIAAVLVKQKAKSVALVYDKDSYDKGMSALVATAAKARGIRVVLRTLLRDRGFAASVARRVRARKAGAFVFNGVTASGCPEIARAVHRVSPRIPLITSDGCTESGFTRRLDAGTAQRTLMMFSSEPASTLGPAGFGFAQRYRARYKRPPGPFSAYGYEAMALALDAINRGGGPSPPNRPAILQALFATRDRTSILGRYSIDANGDTTLTKYGVYRVRARLPAFAFLIDSAAP